MEIPWREPEVIAQGDTLQFKRRLPDYPSGQGWGITYEIRGGAQPIQFISTADADGATHDIYVAPAITALWLPGDEFLEGYVSNGTDRFRVYYGDLKVSKNLEGSKGDANVKTFKQILLEKMEVCVSNFATSGLLETRIGETMFRYTTVEKLAWAYGWAWQMRNNEIKHQRVANGLNSGEKILPRILITATGPAAGQVIYPFGWGNP